MFFNWPWNKMLNLKVDGQLFLCMGGLVKKRGEKSWRINDFRSEWNCQKPSALFTLPLSKHGKPEPLGLPAQGETRHSGSPVCTSGSQLGKRREGRWEEVRYSVLLNLGEDLDDTHRHQLNRFRVSAQFTSRERERGEGGGNITQFIGVCKSA